MYHSKKPFVRGYDGLSVQRLLAISYDDDCPLSYLPLHVSQSHLPDSQVERHACVFCDDFALITEGQNVPPELDAQRSEEHTSELQSLMRISYAVFCLKNKPITTIY